MTPSLPLDIELKERALACTNFGISISDARQPELPLIYVNDAFERMTGYQEQEILGRNCRFLQRHDREQPALEEVRAALRSGGHCLVLLRNYRKDGSLFWNELCLSPIFDANDQLTHFVGIQNDVSERQRAWQENQRLLDDLQATYRELDAFAHVVSHDLRAPLRGVEKLCQMLLSGHRSRLGEDGQKLVRLLDSRVQRLTALLEGVLRYSRARGQVVELRTIDTGELVRGVVELLDLPAEIRIEIADLPTVYSDPIRLGQIFQNLIDNAAKFQCQRGGSISIAGEELEDRWRFSVADEGPGIPEEHHQRIFGMFQTVRNRDRLEPTGVGLAVVGKAVQQLGGRVWVESEIGAGATFHFEISKSPELTKKDASPS